MTQTGFSRRSFVGQSLVLAASTAGLTGRQAAVEGWLNGLDGLHRAFFDVAAVREGILGRADNFLNTYRDEYGLTDRQINLVFGAHSAGLGFVMNDSIWAKYGLGVVLGVTDPVTGAPAKRNLFVNGGPELAWPADYSIATLQRRGVRFLACRGTMRNWSRQLSAAAGSAPETVLAHLRHNLVPGTIEVPAMIVAQNRAQEAGLKYVYVV
jgi:hypothetical protein